MGIFKSSNWILCAFFEAFEVAFVLPLGAWEPTNQPKLWKSPVAFKCQIGCWGRGRRSVNQLSIFRPDIYGSSARPRRPPWDWKIFKLQGLVAGGRWASLPSWGVKRCKISGIFDSFLWMRWKFTFRNQLYSENRMERKAFFRQTLKFFFLGVCAQVGCFERRHEAEIYCILLPCVEGTLGFFCIINLHLWKATKTCDVLNDRSEGHSLLESELVVSPA